jgi:hypothetical protein
MCSLRLLMMDGETETCRMLFQNKINFRYCASGWFNYRILLRWRSHKHRKYIYRNFFKFAAAGKNLPKIEITWVEYYVSGGGGGYCAVRRKMAVNEKLDKTNSSILVNKGKKQKKPLKKSDKELHKTICMIADLRFENRCKDLLNEKQDCWPFNIEFQCTFFRQ